MSSLFSRHNIKGHNSDDYHTLENWWCNGSLSSKNLQVLWKRTVCEAKIEVRLLCDRASYLLHSKGSESICRSWGAKVSIDGQVKLGSFVSGNILIVEEIRSVIIRADSLVIDRIRVLLKRVINAIRIESEWGGGLLFWCKRWISC
jgi:hypothetical protein